MLRIIMVIMVVACCLMPGLPEAGSFDPVVSMELKADPQVHIGICPAVINFTGDIKVAYPGSKKPLVIKYTFVRSDGAQDRNERTLVFNEASTREVKTTWTLGDLDTLPAYNGWVAIRITAPEAYAGRMSKKAEFSIKCNDKNQYHKAPISRK